MIYIKKIFIMKSKFLNKCSMINNAFKYLYNFFYLLKHDYLYIFFHNIEYEKLIISNSNIFCL